MASASLNAADLFSVKDLIAVVTGGGTGAFSLLIPNYVICYEPRSCLLTHISGIGLMIAQGLEANGAIVYIIGRRKEALEKAVATAVSSRFVR